MVEVMARQIQLLSKSCNKLPLIFTTWEQVANIVKKEPRDSSLSTLERSTLQWMLWREGSEEGVGEGGGGVGASGRSTAAAAASPSSDNAAGVNVKGGVLGHLRPEEASTCVHALVHGGVASDDGAAGGRADR